MNVQQRLIRVWYTQAHDLAERAVGFVSNNKRSHLGLRAFRGENLRTRAWLPVSGYGADRVWVEQHYVHNTGQSNVQLTQNCKEATEATKRANRQWSKLAEGSQEGGKDRGKWKVGDKTQDPGGERGARSKKTWAKKNFGTK